MISIASKDLELYTRFMMIAVLPSNPILVFTSVGLLYWVLGIAGVIGFGVSCLVIPLQFFFIKKISNAWFKTNKMTDIRTSIITDMV